MLGSPEIRAAEAAEEEAVRRLLADAALPLDGLEDLAVLLVAVLDGGVVGCAALERHGGTAAPVSLLRSVAVRDELRGTGLGTALVARILAAADALGGPVALLTETASGWFPRFGFVPVPRAELPGALGNSKELQGACAVSARAFLRPGFPRPGR